MLVKLTSYRGSALTVTARHIDDNGSVLFRRFTEPVIVTPGTAYLKAIHRAMRWFGVEKFQVVNLLPGLEGRRPQEPSAARAPSLMA